MYYFPSALFFVFPQVLSVFLHASFSSLYDLILSFFQCYWLMTILDFGQPLTLPLIKIKSFLMSHFEMHNSV